MIFILIEFGICVQTRSPTVISVEISIFILELMLIFINKKQFSIAGNISAQSVISDVSHVSLQSFLFEPSKRWKTDVTDVTDARVLLDMESIAAVECRLYVCHI